MGFISYSLQVSLFTRNCDTGISLYNKTTKGYTPKGTRIAAEQNDLCPAVD